MQARVRPGSLLPTSNHFHSKLYMTAEPLQPTPAKAQEALEACLEPLLQSLLEIGICASDVQEAALESSIDGAGSGYPGGLLGKKAAQTVDHLARLHSLKDAVSNVFIPLEVINSVDQGRNPQLYTRDFIERVAGENMYTNGILSGVESYGNLLNAQLGQAFPELVGMLGKAKAEENGHTQAEGQENVKMEE